nr:hypothetical protein HK105_006683 [Polyrhizophydium stewartii]
MTDPYQSTRPVSLTMPCYPEQNQLLRVYRTYLAMNVMELLGKPPRMKNKYLQKLYVYMRINSKIIISILLIATALGGCGIWGMHFLGMHALHFYVHPKHINSSLPIYDPYTERMGNEYFMILPIYYEAGQTALSLFIAVVTVFIGILVAAFGVGMIHARTDAGNLPKIMKRYQERLHKPVRDTKQMSDAIQSRNRPSVVDMMPNIPRLSAVSPPSALKSTGAVPTSNSTNSTNSEDAGVGATLNLEKTSFLKISLVRKIIFLTGCVITGLGAAAMHYSGVASMTIPGVRMTHNPKIVLLAIIIGVVVGTAGLWILFFLKGKTQRLISPLIIGVAVFSLHYTGMAGVSYELDQNPLDIDYDGYFAKNPSAVGGLLIETIRAQIDFSLELVILAVGFHMLKVD